MEPSVSDHYGRGGLLDRILEGLRRAGKDIDDLDPEDLAKVDEFHVRGRKATEELFDASGFKPGMRVLDIGSGIGGPSRFLARRGLEVTGLDLTPEFCSVARELSKRAGLESIRFETGDALEMPFADATFDGAWMQHANMNIADKAALFREVARVLRPGARFAFHEIVAGPEGEPFLPAPWASSSENSHLASPERFRSELEAAGFTLVHWKVDTEATVEFFHELFGRLAAEGPSFVGLHLLFGDESPTLFRNVARSIEEGRAIPIMGVARIAG